MTMMMQKRVYNDKRLEDEEEEEEERRRMMLRKGAEAVKGWPNLGKQETDRGFLCMYSNVGTVPHRSLAMSHTPQTLQSTSGTTKGNPTSNQRSNQQAHKVKCESKKEMSPF